MSTGRAVSCSCWCRSWLLHCDWLAVVYWDGVTNTHNSISCETKRPRQRLSVRAAKETSVKPLSKCLKTTNNSSLNSMKTSLIVETSLWKHHKHHKNISALRRTMCTATQITWYISFGDKRDFSWVHKWFTVGMSGTDSSIVLLVVII